MNSWPFSKLSQEKDESYKKKWLLAQKRQHYRFTLNVARKMCEILLIFVKIFFQPNFWNEELPFYSICVRLSKWPLEVCSQAHLSALKHSFLRRVSLTFKTSRNISIKTFSYLGIFLQRDIFSEVAKSLFLILNFFKISVNIDFSGKGSLQDINKDCSSEFYRFIIWIYSPETNGLGLVIEYVAGGRENIEE